MIALVAAVAVLPASIASAQSCDEEVVFRALEGTIDIYHHEALFNCCAWIDVEVTQSYEIDVIEWEQFENGPCYCLCCFDVMATIGGLEPGEYLVRVWKALNNFDGTWTFELAAEETVVVDGLSPAYVQTGYIPCVESAILEDPAETTWGTIKGFYR